MMTDHVVTRDVDVRVLRQDGRYRVRIGTTSKRRPTTLGPDEAAADVVRWLHGGGTRIVSVELVHALTTNLWVYRVLYERVI